MGFGKLQMEDSIQSGIRSQISQSNPMGVVKCASVGQAWIDTWKFQIEDFNRWLRSGRLKIEGKRYNYNYKYKYRLAEKQIQSQISGSNPMVVVKCASAGQVWILQSYKLKIQIGIYISRPKSNPMDVVKVFHLHLLKSLSADAYWTAPTDGPNAPKIIQRLSNLVFPATSVENGDVYCLKKYI